MLSASSDASIKLWSLLTLQTLHTFTHHADSVWSLHSNHKNLEVFYSGDKTGSVCRVDVRRAMGEVGEGTGVVVCREGEDEHHDHDHRDGEGYGRRPRHTSEGDGVTRIMVLGDELMWTAASGASVKRWRLNPPSATGDEVQPDSPTLSRANTTTTSHPNDSPSTNTNTIPFHPSASTSLTHPTVPHSDPPHTSLFRLGSAGDPYGYASYAHSRSQSHFGPAQSQAHFGASQASLGRGSGQSQYSLVQSPTQPVQSPGPSQSIQSQPGQSGGGFAPGYTYPGPGSPGFSTGHETSRRPPPPMNASEAMPMLRRPESVVRGSRDGLVRAVLLNDREYTLCFLDSTLTQFSTGVHALSVDESGSVRVWDIVQCTCIGVIPSTPNPEASSPIPEHTVDTDTHMATNLHHWSRSPREILEHARARMEGEAVVNAWCSVETKTGVLCVHVNAPYTDDACEALLGAISGSAPGGDAAAADGDGEKKGTNEQGLKEWLAREVKLVPAFEAEAYTDEVNFTDGTGRYDNEMRRT